AVRILAAVSGLVSSGQVSTTQLVWLVAKMLGFIAVSLAFGVAIIPRLVDYVGRQRSNELLVISVLGLAFSMAIFSRWVGFSEAIGAFIMGVIVSESRYLGDVVRRIEPVRDLFGAIFFITVGMLVNVSFFSDVSFVVTALIITSVFVLAKMFACSLSTFVCGFGARNSMGAGLSMIAIGEFSLMIAVVAIGSEAIDESIYPTVVLVTTITALLVPYSVKYTDKLTSILERRMPKSLLIVASYLNLVARSIRRRSGSSVHLSNEMRNTISRLFVYIVVMISVVALAINALPQTSEYAYLVGGNEDVVLLLIATGTLIVVIFGIAGVWRRTTRIIEVATSEAMLGTKSAEKIGYQATVGSLRWGFLAFYIIIGFIAVSPIIRSLVEQTVIFGIVTVSIIAVAIVALWGSVQTIDRKLAEIFGQQEASPYGESSMDLAEIEDIIATMERGKP
ncbi:MAG: cation:proton antiporter domain-containing protein, partial [Thermoplasmata archaeon]